MKRRAFRVLTQQLNDPSLPGVEVVCGWPLNLWARRRQRATEVWPVWRLRSRRRGSAPGQDQGGNQQAEVRNCTTP